MPIDWLILGGAMLTGLLGGVHCAAMCGGIATGFSRGPARRLVAARCSPTSDACCGYVARRRASRAASATASLGVARSPGSPAAACGGRPGAGARGAAPARPQRAPRRSCRARRAAVAALAATATPPAAGRTRRRQAHRAGHAVGLDALRTEHHAARRRVAAGRARARRADDGRLRPGHPAGDAAADLVQARASAQRLQRGALRSRGCWCSRGPADPRRALADAQPALHGLLAALGCRSLPV